MSYNPTYQVQNEGSKTAFFGYRYAFNGMERDDQWNGVGNSYDFGARIYDSRLGRWLAADKHQFYYSNKSPYQFASNSPILLVDVDGNDNIIYIYVGDSYKRGDQCVQLSPTQQQEVFDKTVKVFEMINQKLENGLGVDVTFARTSTPYESQRLDKSDILAVAADLDYAEQIYGTLLSKIERDDPGITKNANISGDFTKPAFVNMGSSGFAHTSPNLIDQIAYSLAHEIIHRVTQKAGDGMTDHDDHPKMKFNIMENGTQLCPLPDHSLEQWDNALSQENASYFNLLPSRHENFKTVFGGRSPKDNATERVSKKQSNQSPGGLVPKRKRRDFRKWNRKK